MLLSLLLLFSLATPALAANEQPKTVTMLCYNVAGLPSVSGLMGQQGVSVSSNQYKLGTLLNQSSYDVIAVQEDFNYDPLLRSGLTRYKYKTDWSGGGIHIEATSFDYVDFRNNGKSISDHKAASVRFTLTKTGDSSNPESLRVNHLSLTNVLMTKAVTTVRDIGKILSKPNEILGLFTK